MGDPNQACHDATQKALRDGDSEMLGYLASIIDSRKDAADAAIKYAAQLAEATARVGELEFHSMNSAPKDGTEILAWHKDGKTYHQVKWMDDYWGMRWSREYCQYDGQYLGWIYLPSPPDKGQRKVTGC